jgi:TonB family protein
VATLSRLSARALLAPCLAAVLSNSRASAQPSAATAEEAPPAATPAQPNAEGIVPPQLLHFEHAPYPAQALAAGVTGEVLLALTVSADGSVSAVEVLQAAGHGFDEAAREAAKRFRFEPARAAGKAVAVKIPFRYAFTLETPPPPAEPAPAPDASTGPVATGSSAEPLAGAPVGASPEAPVLEVSVIGARPPREVTRRTLERRELGRIPGTSGDALRSLQSLPGIARPPGLAGLLIVRGSAPEDTEVFVDGSTVPIIYHFGGLSSAVPTELLERIDFYPGNFSAKYGRVMGGIVDVGLRSPNTRCTNERGEPLDAEGCFHGLAQVDLIDTRALLQGPLPIDGWTFAAGGRRSWVGTWLKPVLEELDAGVTSAPVYYDYQLVAETKPGPGSKLSLRFFGSDDRLEIVIKSPAAQDPGAFGGTLALGTSVIRAQALYETPLTPDIDLHSMISVGKDSVGFSLGRFRFDLDLYPIALRSEFGFKLARSLRLNVGLDFLVVPFDTLVRLPEPPRPGEPSPGPFTTRPLLESETHSTAFRPAWYAEAELRLVPRLMLTPGVRLDYARDSSHGDVSPRLTARYDLTASPSDESPTPLRSALKAGVGVFHQPPQFQETDAVFGTPGLYSNRSVHLSLGAERELTQQLEVSLEGFYKHLTELVSRTADDNGSFTYANEGDGYAAGAELLLKYKSDERFFGWLAYTLSRSVRRDTPGSEEHLFQYDQTHILTVLGSYKFGRGWEAGARFRLVSGPLDTPAPRAPSLPAVFAADAAAYTPLSAPPFSERLPLFHQLDVRVEKNWQLHGFRLTFFVDVLNVYNHAAAEAFVYNFDFSLRQYQQGLPIIPSLGFRGEF